MSRLLNIIISSHTSGCYASIVGSPLEAAESYLAAESCFLMCFVAES